MSQGDASQYRIRPATNADGPAVQAIVFAALKEHGLTPEPAGTDRDLFDLERHYFEQGGRFDVIEDASGKVVGSVGLFLIDTQQLELRKMYLAPQARGKGRGRRLLEHAVAYARAAGRRRLVLETQSNLKAAIALYTRYGFKRTNAEIHTKRCDQIYELIL